MFKVHVNGALVDGEDAGISVHDHGLVVGDGVFETVLLWASRPFALGRHLDRLARSAAGLRIPMPSTKTVAAAVGEVVAAAGLSVGRIRITVTAGAGPLGSGRLDSAPSLVVAIDELGETHECAAVSVVPWSRNEHGALAGLKTTSYAENALALAHAAAAGADEAIFANTAGHLCEGTGSNVFVVRAGHLLTPPLTAGCLAGVTRALVLEFDGGSEADLPIAEFAPGAITEAFLTSSLRGVQPISAIDGVPLSWPGPHTAHAAATYTSLLERGGDL